MPAMTVVHFTAHLSRYLACPSQEVEGATVRAALESVAFQTADLVAAMQADGAGALAALRVDGGMAANDWFCQFLADILDIVVERPANLETTALGAAMLAGHAGGAWPDALSGESRGDVVRFHSRMDAPARQKLQAGWQTAIRRATAR